MHDSRGQLSGAIRRYDRVISISNAVATSLAQSNFRVSSEVVPNGVDFSAINFCEHQTTQSPLKIVQVGRLSSDCKGQDVLLRAIRLVIDRIGPNAVFADFIGDGPDKNHLVELARTLGVEDHCKFLGSLPRRRVYATLCQYNLLVQPSRWEGFGLTVIEGIGAGLPVLAADIEGPKEILGEGRFGYLFRAGDSEHCANRILQIIEESRSPDFARRQRDIREVFMDSYSIDTTARRYIDEYRDVLAPAPSAAR